MQKQVPKIIVILGPTASGKSAAAIRLAQEFDGEIISADSRQIYTGMNLGTGKIPRDKFSRIFNFQFSIFKHKEEFISEGIVHHLIDVVEPMKDFNVSHFKKAGDATIKEILSRGKVPIICGGSGFWIDTLVNNTTLPKVAPNVLLRNMLRSKSTEELFSKLQKLDKVRAKNIDQKNPARLVRAIEIATALGKVPENKNKKLDSKYEFLQIGISVEKEKLDEKIKIRLNERFNEGMTEEVESLIKNGVSPEWLEKIGLEYRWISRFLQDKVELQEMQKLLYFDIIHYAKRQMTWLKKNKRIIWLKDYLEIESEVEKFLQN